MLIITILGDCNRTPFDLPEAESEIVAGFITEFSSIYFSIILLTEYGNIIVLCSLLIILFSLLFILLIIYSQDLLSNIIESILITLYSINKVVLRSLLSFIFLNIGCTALYISIKLFISISIIVGNIISLST